MPINWYRILTVLLFLLAVDLLAPTASAQFLLPGRQRAFNQGQQVGAARQAAFDRGFVDARDFSIPFNRARFDFDRRFDRSFDRDFDRRRFDPFFIPGRSFGYGGYGVSNQFFAQRSYGYYRPPVQTAFFQQYVPPPQVTYIQPLPPQIVYQAPSCGAAFYQSYGTFAAPAPLYAPQGYGGCGASFFPGYGLRY